MTNTNKLKISSFIQTRKKGVIHLSKAAHRSYCATACGIRLSTPPNRPYYYKGAAHSLLKKVTCKNCKRTFLFKDKLRHFVVNRLLKGKIKDPTHSSGPRHPNCRCTTFYITLKG